MIGIHLSMTSLGFSFTHKTPACFPLLSLNHISSHLTPANTKQFRRYKTLIVLVSNVGHCVNMELITKCLTLFPTAYFFRGSQGGGFHILWKIHFGVSEPNTYIDSLNPRGQVDLQNSRDEVRSKFGRELDTLVENLKPKI